MPERKSHSFFELMEKFRYELHENPELGFEEHSTAQLISKILKEASIEVFEGIGKTGLVARIKKGQSKKSIGLRAELDALAIQEENTFSHRSKNPQKMHACGHDGHSSMLLGAALYLKEHGKFDGEVYFIFQANEERGLGALAMLEDKIFERFPMDSVFAIHNMPVLAQGEFLICEGPVMASEDNFEIEITGKGGHAAIPEKTIDPIVLGSQLVLALQSIVSRNVPASERAVVSITDFETKGTPNVIPEKVILKGDVRSLNPEIQNLVETRMRSLAEGLSAAYGASCKISYNRNFIPTINTKKEVLEARKAAEALEGSPKIHTEASSFMTSEDFGYFLREKPGCYLLLGNGGPNLHSPTYDFNNKNLTLGADFWITLTEQLLN